MVDHQTGSNQNDHNRPQQFFDSVTDVVECNDGAPTRQFRDENDRQHHQADRTDNRSAGRMRKFEQQERALQRKTYLGDSRYRAAEKDRRKPRIPQAHPFQIDSRKNRAERTGGNEKTGQYELFESILVSLPRHSPCNESPEQDICDRYGAEELPPAIHERVPTDRVAAFAFPNDLRTSWY